MSTEEEKQQSLEEKFPLLATHQETLPDGSTHPSLEIVKKFYKHSKVILISYTYVSFTPSALDQCLKKRQMLHSVCIQAFPRTDQKRRNEEGEPFWIKWNDVSVDDKSEVLLEADNIFNAMGSVLESDKGTGLVDFAFFKEKIFLKDVDSFLEKWIDTGKDLEKFLASFT